MTQKNCKTHIRQVVRKRSGNSEGCVYALYCGISGLCKIGCTKGERQARQKAVAASASFPLINLVNITVEDRWAMESLCHRHFSKYHSNGEWFGIDPAEVVEFMALHPEARTIDLVNQARLCKYMLGAKLRNLDMMRRAVADPNQDY
jgi:hypothetical protein